MWIICWLYHSATFKKTDEVNGRYQVVSSEPSVFLPISEGFVNAD